MHYLEIPPGSLVHQNVGEELMHGVVMVPPDPIQVDVNSIPFQKVVSLERPDDIFENATEINYFKFYNKGIEVTAPRGQKLKLNFLDDKDCDEPPKNLDVMIVCECQCQGRETRSRIQCYSEVTSTPYSSHENLIPDPDTARTSASPQSQHSPTSAEAPELSSIGEVGEDLPLGVNIQRRNSAPEISEPLPFVDENSMEL